MLGSVAPTVKHILDTRDTRTPAKIGVPTLDERRAPVSVDARRGRDAGATATATRRAGRTTTDHGLG